MISKFVYKTINSLTLLFRPFTTIQLNCWMELNCNKVHKRNLGDELNFYILSKLTGKKIVNRINTFSKLSDCFVNYICIGSLIEEFTTPKSVIWGAGAIEGGKHPLRNHPEKVLAVRGKYTRQYLLDNNIECPEVYGDPALLCPLVYYPEIKPQNKIGIIPHVSEIDNQYVRKLIEQGAKLIRLDKYDNWTNVIDEILSCECIVSSSLHGLILSDVYSIPNVWITITDQLLGGHFKFLDYFSGVNREETNPIQINENTLLEELVYLSQFYSPIHYNPRALLESAPWKLFFNHDFLKNVQAYSEYNSASL